MTTSTSQHRTRRVHRPKWVSIPLIVGGAVLVSGLVALAAHHTFYAVILYSLVVGLAGGVLGWALVDEFDRQATVLAGAAGLAFAGGIYLLGRRLDI